MSGTAVRLGKECRALGAVWLAGLGTILLARAVEPGFGPVVAAPLAVVLGVWCFGHEFTYRTVPLLLVQPVTRRRQAFEKLGVLAVLMGGLTIAAMPLNGMTTAGLLLGLGAAVALAPALTLLAGNARAGLIFTVAVLLLWYIGTAALAPALARARPDLVPDSDAVLEAARQWSGWLGLIGAATIAWRRFMRLQDIPETITHVGVLSWSAGRTRTDREPEPAHRHIPAAAHRSGPLLALVTKELALQQSLLAISVLAAVLWLVDWRFNDPHQHQAMTFAIALIHGLFVPLLAGAIASAEERRLGTREWAGLQPVRHRTQWAIKAAVAIGLAVVLAAGLPQAIHVINPGDLAGRDLNFVREWQWTLLVVGIAAGSLYVSSLSHNALIALLIAMPANVLIWFGFDYATRIMTSTRVLRAVRASDAYPWFLALVLLVFVGYLLLLLLFAGVNHRTSGASSPRIVRQVAALLLFLILGSLAIRQALQVAIG